MAILGVTVIASLSSDSIVKGLAAGCLGLWISSIGYDGVQGVERFIFSEHLQGGINIIAALVGLFAVPQVIDMLVRPPGAGTAKEDGGSLMESVKTVFRKKRALAIGSAAGVVVGLVPGAGGQIAGLVAYDHARKFSDSPENFGRGEPEGVIAAETANNAMVGPSLVPLFDFECAGQSDGGGIVGRSFDSWNFSRTEFVYRLSRSVVDFY